ncbi:hypothetical protein [Nocardia donostiensis]|uniref:Uncharacterized protein n=1 Tax=Nocardia donostiensis TaxID=1538463 RepID=A0A1W0AX81_9NOCA|nr:hypothetical protein [Nocardia donostiensis]ONM49314.1 hypothetical protein B0T46_08015 [Nocardia donostiensis]OQS14834.1 hypothetical protein B0T36_12275 [Nocardia donostiensis]OQS21837.1 hypothetical protein B0T44_06970 [Nocardia donostiensis]
MQTTTVRGALRGITAAVAVCAALAGGAASAGAAPLALEPASEATRAPVVSTEVAEDFTSSGSSTISSSVNAKVACIFQRTFSAMKLDC